MIGQTLGHYRIVEKLGEDQLDFRTNEKAEPDLPLEETDDPVRIYLREMGTVPLLTREGIVKLTKGSLIDPQDIGLQPVSNPPC